MAKKIKKQGGSFWPKLFVIAGFAAIFVCGVIVGSSFNRPMFYQNDCERLANKIVTLNTKRMSGPMHEQIGRAHKNMKKLAELNRLYARNCGACSDMVNVQSVKIVGSESRQMPKPINNDNKVVTKPVQKKPAPKRACETHEGTLKSQLKFYGDEASCNPQDHLNRAQIYANLAERGCAENRQYYNELALREVDIYIALTEGLACSNEDVKELINAYKKTEMKRVTGQAIDKMKKVADPAIDFILEVEKIINE